jgi:hypothetical protein
VQAREHRGEVRILAADGVEGAQVIVEAEEGRDVAAAACLSADVSGLVAKMT